MFGSTKVDQRDSQTLFGTQARRKICSGGKQPSGGAVVVEDVRKEDGKLKAVEKFLVDDRKIPSWMLWVQDSFPGRLWGLFSLLKNLWALFLEFFGLRWALHSRYIFAARWFLGSIKPDYGTSRRNLKFARVRLRHHNREPCLVLRNVGSFRFLWGSWTMGIFFGIGKGWILDMEILDNKMYQSCTGWQTSVITWIPKGHK